MVRELIRRVGMNAVSLTLVCSSAVRAAEMDTSAETEIHQYVLEAYPDMNSCEREKIEKEIYLEKYVESSLDVQSISEEDDDTDLAYENMIQKENYIVTLISTISGADTSREDWKYNLHYLKDHYSEILELSDVNQMYVDLYIEDYENVEATENMPDSQVNVVKAKTASYRSSDAVAYAKKYYSSYNTAYPDWTSYGGDCANFISQCLYAGGKSMKGTPGTTTAAQDWSNWFSKGTSCNTKNVSSTWRGANAFKSYWQGNASGYKKFSSVSATAYSYGFTGDAVSLLNSNGSAYHTLMIVGYDSTNKDFIVAAHTSNTRTKKLSSYSPAGGFIIYNMR